VGGAREGEENQAKGAPGAIQRGVPAARAVRTPPPPMAPANSSSEEEEEEEGSEGACGPREMESPTPVPTGGRGGRGDGAHGGRGGTCEDHV
jgi:hypothetical protein